MLEAHRPPKSLARGLAGACPRFYPIICSPDTNSYVYLDPSEIVTGAACFASPHDCSPVLRSHGIILIGHRSSHRTCELDYVTPRPGSISQHHLNEKNVKPHKTDRVRTRSYSRYEQRCKINPTGQMSHYTVAQAAMVKVGSSVLPRRPCCRCWTIRLGILSTRRRRHQWPPRHFIPVSIFGSRLL